MAYKNLQTWIEDFLSETEKKCTALVCLYEVPNGGTKEVHTQSIQGRTWDTDLLYRMFKNMAENHVQDRPGLHTFLIQACYDNNPVPSKTGTFLVSDGELKNGGSGRGVITEHPTNTGLVAQQMRHVENMMQTNNTLVQTMAGTWVSERRSIIEENSALRAEVNDSFAVIRDILMQQNEREHKMRLEALDFQRTSEERAMMIKMAPSLINTMTGKEVIPNNVGDSAIIDAMCEKLTDEQVNFLVDMKFIPEHMKPILLARGAKVREDKAKQVDIIKKLPDGDTGNASNVTSITKAKG